MIKFGKWVVKHRFIILILGVLLLVPSALGMANTRINYDILSYLPKDIETMKGQDVLMEDFGKGGFSMVMIDGMTDKQVSDTKKKIEKIDHVADVVWYDTIADITLPKEVLPENLYDFFNSGDSTLMAVFFDDTTSADGTMAAIEEIRNVADKQCFVSGLSAVITDTKNLSEKETVMYVVIAVLLTSIVLAVTMDSFLVPLFFMLSIGFAILYNLGSNYFMGEISFITKALSAVLQLGVTMDYSIFLWHSYKEKQKVYPGDKERAMAHAISNTFVSVAGSSITTIAGFLAMCFMSFTLGLDLGIVMAKGVIIGVLSVVIILPAFMLVFDDAINRHKHKPFSPDFGKLVNHLVKRKKVFAAVFIIIIIPSVLLSANVKKNYNLNAELPDDATTTVGTKLLKEKFNMTTSHFIIVDDTIPASKLVSMENEISNVKGVSSMLAYDMFVGTSIPDSIVPDDIIDIVKQNGRQVMLVNSIYESSTDECNSQVEEIDNIVQKYAGSDHYGYVTGEGALYKDLIETTKVDFAVTSIISIIAVFIVIAIVFKSISIPFILIFAIEVAIWINQGISTVFGTAIPFIAPTVISCIQLGATVDYAILLTSRFKEELSKGHGRTAAMKIAANEAIRSVFQSAMLFFFATFGVYLVCSISIVKSICAMLARGSLISALVIVLFVMPILLLCEKFIARTTKGWGIHDDTPEPEPIKAVPEKKNVDEYEFDEETSFTFTDDD